MKKLTLDPAQLRVQTLDLPAAEAGGEGTVRALEKTLEYSCAYPQCGTVARAMSCYSGCTDPEFC